jgi:hypothetical protein
MNSLPHNERNWMPAYGSVILCTTTVLLGIRIHSRFQGTSGKLGFDDALIVIGWALAASSAGLIIICKLFDRPLEKFGFNRISFQTLESLASIDICGTYRSP